MSEVAIALVGTSGPPLFRFSSGEQPVAGLLEITVTPAGSDEPHWKVVRDLPRLDDAAIPVSEVQYGVVPAGMHEAIPAKPLTPGDLYEIRVSGHGTGLLEFYA